MSPNNGTQLASFCSCLSGVEKICQTTTLSDAILQQPSSFIGGDDSTNNWRRHCLQLWHASRVTFISHCSSNNPRRKNDWHLYGGLWREAEIFTMISRTMWVMNLFAAIRPRWNLTRNQPHFQPIAESLADETVHIFNCTKIPLKFALNKLSRNKRNIKSIFSSWNCNSFAPGRTRRHSKRKNFHFKRFLSYFHWGIDENAKKPTCCWCLNKFE